MEWIEHLTTPILNTEDLTSIVVWADQPKECLSRIPMESGILIEYLMSFVGRFRETSCEARSSLVKRLAGAISQQGVRFRKLLLPNPNRARPMRAGTASRLCTFLAKLASLVVAKRALCSICDAKDVIVKDWQNLKGSRAKNELVCSKRENIVIEQQPNTPKRCTRVGSPGCTSFKDCYLNQRKINEDGIPRLSCFKKRNCWANEEATEVKCSLNCSPKKCQNEGCVFQDPDNLSCKPKKMLQKWKRIASGKLFRKTINNLNYPEELSTPRCMKNDGCILKKLATSKSNEMFFTLSNRMAHHTVSRPCREKKKKVKCFKMFKKLDTVTAEAWTMEVFTDCFLI